MSDSTEIKALTDDVIKIPRPLKIGLLIVAIIFDISIFTYATLCLILQNQVNAQLGFDYATPVEDQGEIFIITEVLPRKIMDQAGLKEGDSIQWDDVSILYRSLIFNQNRTIGIPVMRDEQFLEITLQVPPLNLTNQPRLGVLDVISH